jgi:hypothetical protein
MVRELRAQEAAVGTGVAVGEGVDPGTGAVVGDAWGLRATAATGALVGATRRVAGAFGAEVGLGAAALPAAEGPGRTVLVGTWLATGTATALAGATPPTGGATTVRTM